MRIIEIKLYKFNELSESAKEKARDWYREGAFRIDQDAFDYVQGDSEDIGLRIVSLRPTGIQGNNEGRFITTAQECAEKVLANHGDACETHKTAKAYLKDRAALAVDDDGDFVDQDAADELTRDFLYSLLEDYRIMFEKEVDYQNSDSAVNEMIEANEYEFTEDGERA